MFIKENFKLNGKIISYKKFNMQDGRVFLDHISLLKGIAGLSDSEIKEICKMIPKPYFKNFTLDNGEKIKLFDEIALGGLSSYVNNYEFYKFCNNKDDRFWANSLCENLDFAFDKLKELKDVQAKVRHFDDMEEDLQHDLENGKFKTDKDKIEFANEMEGLRVVRRHWKNKLAYLQKVDTFMTDNGIDTIKIKELKNDVSKLDYVFEKRVYNHRLTQNERGNVRKEIKTQQNTVKKQIDPKQREITKMMKKARIR